MEFKVLKKPAGVNRNLVKWAVKASVLLFIFYMGFAIVNQFVKINDKKEHLSSISAELELQKTKNDELKRAYNATDAENEEYFVKKARELNMAKPNERIFVNR